MTISKNPPQKALEFHREMFKRRLSEAASYRGLSRKEVVERVNTVPVTPTKRRINESRNRSKSE